MYFYSFIHKYFRIVTETAIETSSVLPYVAFRKFYVIAVKIMQKYALYKEHINECLMVMSRISGRLIAQTINCYLLGNTSAIINLYQQYVNINSNEMCKVRALGRQT